MTERTASAGGVVGDELADPQAYQAASRAWSDRTTRPRSRQRRDRRGARRALVAETGPDLRTRPAPGEWSVLECLGHALDGELVMSGRYRWALAEDDPEIVGYDQDRWVTALDHGRADPGDLLHLFDALRAANLALWNATAPALRARTVRHRERGPESMA